MRRLSPRVVRWDCTARDGMMCVRSDSRPRGFLSRFEEGGEAAGAHLLLEGGVVGILDGLHSGGEGGGDVFGAVVDEEDVGGGGGHAFGGVAVDGGFRLGDVEDVRPGVVVEGLDPGMAGAEAGLHGVAHVGEDAGADAGALEAVDPVEHGRIELAPEVNVGGDEGGELRGGEGDPGTGGGFVPEGFGGEVATVVGVAVGPVAVVEMVFAEAGDGAHARPGGGVGWAGEDHAVVEENCFNWSHISEITPKICPAGRASCAEGDHFVMGVPVLRG